MDVLAATQQFSDFLREGKALGKGELADFRHVIIAGMGGSGIAGDLVKLFVNKIPVFSVKYSQLPKFANSRSLVFVVSYSGDTDETVQIYYEARKKNAQVIVITSGGRLRDMCIRDNVPYIRIPSGIPPRAALPFLLLPILNTLHLAGVADDFRRSVDDARRAVDGPALRARARDLAESLKGRIPLIYASDRFFPIAYRWKTQFNENAKVMAFANSIPEMNHNEIEAIHDGKDKYYAILLRDEEDPLSMKKRIDLTKKFITEKGVDSTEIAITGKDLMVRVMTAIILGDLTSLALAGRYNVDPTPTETIERFKQEL